MLKIIAVGTSGVDFQKIGKPVFTFAFEDTLECCLKFFLDLFWNLLLTHLIVLCLIVYSFAFH